MILLLKHQPIVFRNDTGGYLVFMAEPSGRMMRVIYRVLMFLVKKIPIA